MRNSFYCLALSVICTLTFSVELRTALPVMLTTKNTSTGGNCVGVPFSLQIACDSDALKEAVLQSLWSAKHDIWTAMKPTAYRYAMYAGVGFFIFYVINKYINYQIHKRAAMKGTLKAFEQNSKNGRRSSS